MNEFLSSYIETALWSSTDDNNEPLDKKYSASDLAPDALLTMSRDCERFQEEYTKVVNALDYTSEDFPESQVAHDFWLTRNRHGAGFWDGDYPENVGKVLTELSHSFGECYLYFGDDNKLYIG